MIFQNPQPAPSLRLRDGSSLIALFFEAVRWPAGGFHRQESTKGDSVWRCSPAILLGRLVAASSLTASNRNDIQDFMSLCRQAQLQHYIAAVKSTGAELGPDSGDSPAGQMRPADERAVIAATGMPSMEVTACIFACATFRVPTVLELST